MFHAVRSCHPWAAGSAVPVLVRRMQSVQFFSVTDELAPCPFTQNTEKGGLSTLHMLLHCGLYIFMCFNLSFSKLEVCKQSPKMLVSYHK